MNSYSDELSEEIYDLNSSGNIPRALYLNYLGDPSRLRFTTLWQAS